MERIQRLAIVCHTSPGDLLMTLFLGACHVPGLGGTGQISWLYGGPLAQKAAFE